MKVSMEALVELIRANTNNSAVIKGTWEDYGAGMWWNTIIINEGTNNSYQALNPKEHRMLMEGDFTIEMAIDFIQKMKNRGW